MDMTEARLQQECYMWFHNTYISHRGLFFRIKNEDHNRITGARNKATGVVPGVADSCLLIPHSNSYQFGGTVFIEFKSEKGKQSINQINWQRTVETVGCMYYIIRTKQEFIELCQILLD